jgi:hypothetical protein
VALLQRVGFGVGGEKTKKKTEPVRGILLYYGIWWEGKIGKKKSDENVF